jgi:hypothetical protein
MKVPVFRCKYIIEASKKKKKKKVYLDGCLPT